MKEKNKILIVSIADYGEIAIIIGAIAIIIFAFGLLVFGVYEAEQNNKIHIYKNECVNETILIDYTYTEFCLYGIDRNITPVCPRMNDKIVFLEPITLGVSEQLRLGKKAITKERCEKKEVEEIDGWFENSCSGACDCYKTDFSCELTEWAYNNLSEETKVKWQLDKKRVKFGSSVTYDDIISYVFNDICIGESVSSRTLCKSSISKKDLTKEWLDENCECIEEEYICPYFFYKVYNYSSFGKTNFICHPLSMINCLTSYRIGVCSGQAKNPIIKCQRYKCFEDYFIEVN